MSIQPLPGDVVAQITSSAVITSLNGVICGLLQNSLDAGASKINIAVDYSRGNCSAEDNGVGIAPSSFQELGGLGKLHCTSKYPPRPDCHGQRGEFLASLASISLLSIASHHRDYRTHNSLIIHNSRVVARNLPAPPEQRVLAFASGTRVVVRDLFGSMPVRVKQRATEVERMGTSREFEQLVFNVVALLLPWPGEVTISIQDSYAHRTVPLQVSGAVDLSQNYRTNHSLLSRTTMLLAQASMVETQDSKSWVPIGATAAGISVRGCVSLQPVPSRRVQFIAIGIQPLLNEHHSNLFYEDVNRVFENSSFGVVEEASLDDDGRPAKTQGFTGRELKPKRGIDRWPIFFLHIKLDDGTSSADPEQFLGNKHQVSVIADLLQVMVYEFLKKHHFRPRSVTAVERLRKEKRNPPAPTSEPPKASSSDHSRPHTVSDVKRPRSGLDTRRHVSSTHSTTPAEKRSASPFTSWLRTKSTVPKQSVTKDQFIPTLPAQETYNGPSTKQRISQATTEKPLFDKSGTLLRKPFDDVEETQTTSKAASAHDRLPDPAETPKVAARETVVWVDPSTKIKSLIDPRTGFAVKSRSNTERTLIPRPTRQPPTQEVLRIRQWKPAAAGEQGTVFQATEPRIPQVLQAAETLGCAHGGRNSGFQDVGDLAEASNGNMLSTLEGRISKASLQKAEVVAQVDRKFILAKVVANSAAGLMSHLSESDHVLLLIDQHAADERCKVETLLEAYFVLDPADNSRLVAQMQMLDRPLRFDLSRQDGELLVRFERHFSHWGILYEVFQSQETTSRKGVTVEVRALPPSILERCRLEPRLLIDLLRKEIWKLHGSGSSGTRSSLHVSANTDWVARFHDCPEGILDLIYSRACRSAIMFNDPLTVQQCADLVQRLAACAFPFQCAHGRPSMVPMVHLGRDGALEFGLGSPGAEPRDGNLLGALKRWKRRREGESG